MNITATLLNSSDTILWSLNGPGGLSSSTGPSTSYLPPIDPNAQAVATVTASAAGLSATTRITINPTPRLRVTPSTLTVTAGDPGTVFTAVGATGTVTWSLTVAGGTFTNPGTTTTFTPPAHVDADTPATLTASAGGLTASAQITINFSPITLTATPQRKTVNAGDVNIAIVATLIGSTAPITWSLVGRGTLSTTAGSVVRYTPPASVAFAEGAALTATAASHVFTVDLIIFPAGSPRLFVGPEGITVNAGSGPTPFAATLTGSAGPITWILVVGPGTLSTSSGPTTNYTPPTSVTQTEPAMLLVSAGGLLVDVVVITINPPGTATLRISPPSTTIVAGSADIPFTATLSGATGAITWSLSAGGGNFTSSGPSCDYLPPFHVDADQLATLTASAAGVTATAQITIKFSPILLTVSPFSKPVNAGDGPSTFTANLLGSTAPITWSLFGEGTLSTSSGAVTTYTPPATVPFAESAILTASAAGHIFSVPAVINPTGTARIVVSPESRTVNAGNPASTFTATLTGSTNPIIWSLFGPGTLSTATGTATSYTPPASVAGTETAFLFADAGGHVDEAVTITILP